MLQSFRFTNAYRASDRVSQYLIRKVINGRRRTWRDTFLRCILFKIFNKIETWELLVSEMGDISYASADFEGMTTLLDDAMRAGSRIYSPAYIMPCATIFGERSKHAGHLRLVGSMLDAEAPEAIASARSMAEAFSIIESFPSLGPFLSYQFVTDLNYSDHLDFSENEFVVPGPGARSGIVKCFSDPGDLSMADIIRWTMETQREQFASRGIVFDDLWGRPLQLIDCQNLYCEVDKYSRVAHPEFSPPGGRMRIKQRFSPVPQPLSAWYPPKWGINDMVAEWLKNGKRAKECAL